ncbi:MAG: sigma-54 dependent transcriptional regulator [Victivallaceae bacterium]|nr:sigma-54 dependent transcriptional regulator [Victivallaceae bacterium]
MEEILIVDDNQDLCLLLSDSLTEAGYGVRTAACGKQAVKTVVEEPPDIVLLDIHLPDLSGMKVLKKLKKHNAALLVIMLTAYGDIKNAVEAIKAGAFDYITKPFNKDELLLVIKRALDNREMNRKVDYLHQELVRKFDDGNIIGDSEAIRQIKEKVKMVAPTNMTVVIHGESGVGKDLFAAMLHRESRRSGEPYIPIDCGAIPDTLVESELFGHEKGAFTGAVETHKGKFEQANGGTLFLDEITNLPESAQAKLLRALEERKIWHVGGHKAVELDVRIIAATNVDIGLAVKQNRFRTDLFHRLNEFSLTIPPLRERQEDIVAIANHFIVKANQELGKNIKGVSPEALEILQHHSWPGNVRELRNAIKIAVLSAENARIVPEDLPSGICPHAAEYRPEIENDDTLSLDAATNHFEAQLIEQALSSTGGNKARAAEILQIDRKALYRKMRRLELF